MSSENFLKILKPLLIKYSWSKELLYENSFKQYRPYCYSNIGRCYLYLQSLQDQDMYNFLMTRDRKKSIRFFVADAIEFRLIELYKDTELLHLVSPYFQDFKNLDYILEGAWNTSDTIWKSAADLSIDFNYYTKRISLSAIYINCMYTLFKDGGLDKYKILQKFDSTKKIQYLRSVTNFSICKNIPLLRYIWAML